MSSTPVTSATSSSAQGTQKKKDPAAMQQKKQEYQDLVNQAQQLGITNIPAPGKGAIENLQSLIDAKQGQQSGNNNNKNLFSASTVGLQDQSTSGTNKLSLIS